MNNTSNQAMAGTADEDARATVANQARRDPFFQHSMGYLSIHDLDGTLLAINPAAARALGYAPEELEGIPMRDLMRPSSSTSHDEYLAALRRNGQDKGVVNMCHRDGSLRTWQYSNRLFQDANGDTRVLASGRGITRLRAAEESARRDRERVRMIADALPLRIAHVNKELRFEFLNVLYECLYQRKREALVGTHLADVLDADTFAARLPYFQRALEGQFQQFEVERDGQFEEVTFLPEVGGDGQEVLGFYVMAQNVTSERAEKQRLIKLTRMDNLTGLLNRSGVLDRLKRAIKRSRDQGSALAVLYMDLDRFKQVNDRLGHPTGDWVLQTVAQRLGQVVRTSDALGRLGGDEFLAVIDGVNEPDILVQMAERIVSSVRWPFVSPSDDQPLPLQIGISLGVAQLESGDHDDPVALLERADKALYQAKRAGRGTWRMAPPPGTACAVTKADQ